MRKTEFIQNKNAKIKQKNSTNPTLKVFEITKLVKFNTQFIHNQPTKVVENILLGHSTKPIKQYIK